MTTTNPPKSIAFHTFGCKVNQYETEELRGQLALGGFRIVDLEQEADVYVINSCTVTADADSSCRQLVRKLARERPSARLVVTGCYAERSSQELQAVSPRVEVFGNHEKPLIATTLGVPTACVEAAAQQGVGSLADRTRAYIKIQDGCDAKCTYCIIPSVRPSLKSRSPGLILREANRLIEKGYREIVLTGVRLGRYSAEGDQGEHWDFSALVKALVRLSGDFRIRLSSIEVTEIPDDVVRLASESSKLCPFFHIPLQSGDDEMLKRMGRWYTSGQYRERIRAIRGLLPEAAFSADVIVGFAGETDERFQRTVALLEQEAFSRVHAFRYSVRPGTSAERLRNHVDGRVKAERTRAMVKVDQLLRKRFASRFIGKSVRVLCETNGAGYSAEYIRVRGSKTAQVNSFFEAVGKAVGEDGLLLV